MVDGSDAPPKGGSAIYQSVRARKRGGDERNGVKKGVTGPPEERVRLKVWLKDVHFELLGVANFVEIDQAVVVEEPPLFGAVEQVQPEVGPAAVDVRVALGTVGLCFCTSKSPQNGQNSLF